jgi:3-oxoacyl-[acyl-carrier protein] reductase
MQLKLEGRRALVCGGSRGIGLAAAQAMAQIGAEVTLLARSEDSLKEAVSTLSAGSHSYIAVDVSNLENLRDKVEREHKKKPFSILINNSGGPKGGPISEAKAQEFLDAFSNHLLVSSDLSQLLLPSMRENSFGRIVNIISTSVKAPIPGLGVSNTIRGAVASWAKTLSREVAADGVTVNCVLPGFTATQRLDSLIEAAANKNQTSFDHEKEVREKSVPTQRFGRPEEVGDVIAFLCSPSASYVNGVALPVDGGRTPCY